MGWLELLRSPFALDDLAGPPFVADVHTDEEPTSADVVVLRSLAAVTVAVVEDTDRPPSGSAAFDVVVDRAGLDAVTTAAQRSPQAAVVLAQVLRAGETRDPVSGLVAESLAYSTLQGGPEFRAWLASRPIAPPKPATRPPVRVESDGDVRRVVLDRPDVHNAFSAAMRDHLVEALRGALADAGTRVILLGDGPSFSSGGDLTEFGSFRDPASAHVIRTTRSPAWWLATHAERVDAHVHGACVGAGAELSAFCGRVTAAADAWFALPEVAMGLVPGAGGTVSIPRRIGRQRAAWLALTGARIDAARALAWGLVDAVE
ncbi:MAG: putative enoyl-CoA hydratase/isomerase [Acidimicrobiales bacterium]|nr:putative enoyl-CoA hydratase/isomerase [Acidimicrobiales bacterium]